jgi:hypothetical protein
VGKSEKKYGNKKIKFIPLRRKGGECARDMM